MASVWPYSQPPTVDDLRVKLCWICQEEETSDSRTSASTGGKWVHPCNCVLVAHESCLLAWIASLKADPHRSKQTIACPQCATPYKIESDIPNFLRPFMHYGNSFLSKFMFFSTVASISACVYICAGSYGPHALRYFLGPQAYRLTFRSFPFRPSSSPSYSLLHFPSYIIIPQIPIALTLSCTSFHQSTLPSMTFAISTLFVSAGSPYCFGLSWPPSPALTVLAFPVLRGWYRQAYTRVFYTLMPLYRPKTKQLPPPPIHPHHGRLLPTASDTPLPTPPPESDELLPLDSPNPPTQRRFSAERTKQFCTTVVGALALPVISSMCGELLFRASKRSCFMRCTLGLNDFEKRRGVGRLSRLALDQWSFSDLDPVWWRNAIGVSLFLLLKDSVKLFYYWNGYRERRSRKLVSRDFKGVHVDELDLIVD